MIDKKEEHNQEDGGFWKDWDNEMWEYVDNDMMFDYADQNFEIHVLGAEYEDDNGESISQNGLPFIDRSYHSHYLYDLTG